ncbi:hypothetical protein N7508_000204 [Penicillium antarcticum]|nr:uncharacterized protein N7508_000204 [Penicillium antarcticum]KAJ5319921.1 hypothetical protein N7508_000204 [Penicillium antarcticum]
MAIGTGLVTALNKERIQHQQAFADLQEMLVANQKLGATNQRLKSVNTKFRGELAVLGHKVAHVESVVS